MLTVSAQQWGFISDSETAVGMTKYRDKWCRRLRCHSLARQVAPDRGRARLEPAMMISADDRQTLDSIEEGLAAAAAPELATFARLNAGERMPTRESIRVRERADASRHGRRHRPRGLVRGLGVRMGLSRCQQRQLAVLTGELRADAELASMFGRLASEDPCPGP